ncbi:hypothetical protein [Inediibacterium massiliense]|uniref:hypothetical protein n=1 Tax=Inediibacterium massiliense TaxID=1658111 RepID=UPI0006B53300|nr:hypothetical protein [Inediibacterium massiliense]
MKAKKILGLFLLILIPFSIVFSFKFPNGFVLGEVILKNIGISIYSNLNTGLYFPGILALIFLATGWIGSSKLLKNKYPKLVKNLFWFIFIFLILLKSMN